MGHGVEGYRSVRDITCNALRRAIIVGELGPGERLKEQELAGKFGVSTTPIKQALQRLETEGLVESNPLRGSRVSARIESTIAETGLLRSALEGLAAYLAAHKANEEDIDRLRAQLQLMRELTNVGDLTGATEANSRFHDLIHEISDNFPLQQMLSIVRSFGEAMREKTLLRPNEARLGLQEHEDVLESIERGDATSSREGMERHVLRSAQIGQAGSEPKALISGTE